MTMNWINLTNFAITISGLVISLLSLFLMIFLRRITIDNNNFFFVFFFLIFCYSLSSLISELSENVLLSRISLFFSSLFPILLIVPFFIYMLSCAGKSCKGNRLFYAVVVLCVIYFFLLIITQFTTFIYYFTPDNEYHRGPFYIILLIPPILIMIINIIELFRNRSALSTRQKTFFLIYFLMPLLGMVIQLFFYGLLLIVLSITLSTFCIFMFHLLDQSEKYYREIEKNIQNQANILVLQMRPHFIYNTLTSIYYLCQNNPTKAQKVTLDFSQYLKKNFTAIASDKCVPFTEELAHAQAYLNVEKARFEDKLFVVFDTPVTMFTLPPLTLQPIVENAVKYGVSPGLDPLHISIKTQKSEEAIKITVEDDGPGFVEPKENEPHIALENIRKRLKITCNGSLDIESQKGLGTKVTILLPIN